jgi:S-formylglutathione hydrolase FrmB
LSNLDFTDAGDYWAVVTNSVASVTSTPANLLVNPAGVSLGMYPGLTIQGVVGRTYGIQYVTSLSETNQWTTLTSITLAQPVQLWVDTNANASLPINSQRFYRVIAVP